MFTIAPGLVFLLWRSLLTLLTIHVPLDIILISVFKCVAFFLLILIMPSLVTPRLHPNSITSSPTLLSSTINLSLPYWMLIVRYCSTRTIMNPQHPYFNPGSQATWTFNTMAVTQSPPSQFLSFYLPRDTPSLSLYFCHDHWRMEAQVLHLS